MSTSRSPFSQDYIIQWATQIDNFEEDRRIYIVANTYAYKEQFPDLEECTKNTMKLPQEFQGELTLFKTSNNILHWARILKNEKEILGFCIFEEKERYSFYLRELAIDPDYWGKDIARHLVFSILRKFPKTKKLFLMTRFANKRALNLYKKCGFNKINIKEYGDLSRFSEQEFQGLEWVLKKTL